MEIIENRKLAVLIDGDNASAEKVEELFEEIAKFGTANVKRIYGDWTSDGLKSWKEKLLDFAIVPIQQFAYTKGKNATDMQLIIDAIDLLHETSLDGFCIISSDSDFTPLVSRLRQSGKMVYGFGKKQTPKALIKACNQFIYVENLGEDDNAAANSQTQKNLPTTQQVLDGGIKTLLFSAIKAKSDEMGWAYVSGISNYINGINPDFDPRSYGYAKISNMLKNLGNLQFKVDEQSRMFCRKIPLGKLYALLRELPSDFKDQNGWIKIDDKLDKVVKEKWDYTEYGLTLHKAFGKLYNAEMKDDKIKLNLN